MAAHTPELSARALPEATLRAWGWPLVRPGGVVAHVLAGLSLDASVLPPLLALPEAVHPLDTEERVDALRALLTSYARHLDPDLAFEAVATAPAAALAARGAAPGEDADSPLPWPQDGLEFSQHLDANDVPEGVPPLSPSGRASSSSASGADAPALACDEPRAADALPARSASLASSAGPFSRASLERAESAVLHSTQAKAPDGDAAPGTAAPDLPEAPALTEGAPLCEPFFDVAMEYRRPAAAASLAAVQAVLAAALRPRGEPRGADATSRWLDARVRVAATRLAHWLRVPRAALAALEAATVAGVSPAAAVAASQQQLHAYHDKAGAAWKVGAAAFRWRGAHGRDCWPCGAGRAGRAGRCELGDGRRGHRRLGVCRRQVLPVQDGEAHRGRVGVWLCVTRSVGRGRGRRGAGGTSAAARGRGAVAARAADDAADTEQLAAKPDDQEAVRREGGGGGGCAQSRGQRSRWHARRCGGRAEESCATWQCCAIRTMFH
jgi:hypothetical protein